MTFAIDPVLVSFGPTSIRWFGVLALLGVVLACGLGWRALRADPADRHAALRALAWALPVGILAARAGDILGGWDYYLIHAGELGQLDVGRLAPWAGLLGGIGIAAWVLRKEPDRRRRIFDALGPPLAVGLALGALGAAVDGHGLGAPSTLPWATVYTDPFASVPDFGTPRHPVPLYDALFFLGLAAAVAGLRRGVIKRRGLVAAAFVVLVGSWRLATSSVRLESSFLFGLQFEQFAAAGLVLAGLWYAAHALAAHRVLAWRRPRAAPAAVATVTASQKDTLAA